LRKNILKNFDFLTTFEINLEKAFLDFMNLESKNNIREISDKDLEAFLISILEKNNLSINDLETFGRYVHWRATEGYFLDDNNDCDFDAKFHRTFLECDEER
jgi:hypothetical protein